MPVGRAVSSGVRLTHPKRVEFRGLPWGHYRTRTILPGLGPRGYLGYRPGMTERGVGRTSWTLDADDPRAPSEAEWAAMSEQQRADVVASLP